MNRIAFFLFLILFAEITFAQEPSKSVFYSAGNNRPWILYQNNNQALYKIITNEAFTLLEEREQHIKNLTTKADWTTYQKELKSKFGSSLAKFQKTPLNAKVTGKLERENFTVEKIIFESHPGFYVTAAMLIPKKLSKPAPAVIYCSGHTELGFRSDVYQRVMMNLVEKGFVVFAFDPIGQGERLQYVDPQTGKSKVGGSTTEHSYAGVQTLLTGTPLSDYFIWDGVRAIDYLETRKEVDAKRIGITGRSGGGTQSALIAAYDERVYAAAPECYITSFKRLLQSIGPQDAEQNPFHFIKSGMDHADFMHLRAPKPTLIVTTTHDFFSQQGARETFAEAKKSYSAFGFPENVKMTEDFGVHESTKNNRESVYAFFQESLDLPGNSEDLEIVPFTFDELLVTSTGQIGNSLKGKTIFELNQAYFRKKTLDKNQLTEKIKTVSGIDFTRKTDAAVFTGKIKNDQYEVEKYFLENNKRDYALPVYIIKNANSNTDKILFWLSSMGKEQLLPDAVILPFLNAGYTVITADLPGIGELNDPGFKGDGFVQKVPFNYTFGANLVGKSISGIQAEAMDLVRQFMEEKNPGDKTIHAIVSREMVSAFLHFTAFKNPFSKIVLMNPLESNLQLIKTEYYDPKMAYSVVPGSLPFYDFQDLVTLLPENSVKIIKDPDANSEALQFFRK